MRFFFRMKENRKKLLDVFQEVDLSSPSLPKHFLPALFHMDACSPSGDFPATFLFAVVRRTSAPFTCLAAARKTSDLLLITMPFSPQRRDHETKRSEEAKWNVASSLRPSIIRTNMHAHVQCAGAWSPLGAHGEPSSLCSTKNTESRGQNNLYLLNKTLKDHRATSCSPPIPLLPFTTPLTHTPLPPHTQAHTLKGLVNVSKLHIRRRSQTINLKDTHRVPAGFSRFCSVNTSLARSLSSQNQRGRGREEREGG